jgi:hypothetical protein
MTVLPSWSPPDPPASAYPGPPGAGHGPGPGSFRNLLGAVQPAVPLGHLEFSQRFNVGGLNIVLQPAGCSLEAYLDIAQQRLKRKGWSCEAPYRAAVLGFDGWARVVTKKKKLRRPAGEPQLQLYTMVGPYSLTVTVAEEQAALAQGFGPVRLDPAPPPVVTPVLRLPADISSVEEKLTITRPSERLTALVTPGLASMSTDQFVMTSLGQRQRQAPDIAVGDYQPDVFLGGWPCVRHTFVHGGNLQAAVRSEFWWAGVVADRGIQVSVIGTKSIIDQGEARRLQDLVALIPPG